MEPTRPPALKPCCLSFRDTTSDFRVMTRFYIAILALACALSATSQTRPAGRNTRSSSAATSTSQSHETVLPQSYAWRVISPLGLREPAPMDTLTLNYYRQAIPSEAFSYAWACTGNMGAEGKNMLFMHQPRISDFFLHDAQMQYVPTLANQKFYNSRIPFTYVSYNAGGGRDNSQERLQTLFSANINKKAQIGANLDYIYSKGSYANQAAKGLTWGLNGSYIGDRYELQASWNHYNLLNKENGGITDDLYITDPAKLQGGISTISAKSIPTNLANAHTRVKGGELFVNNKYNVGFWREEKDEETDSIISREYVPVTAFIWTLNYKDGAHRFLDTNKSETSEFFEHTYLNPDITDDMTKYSSLSNTIGVSLLEGFNKYAKFGLAAYVRHELRKFTQTTDTIDRAMPEDVGLTPFPEGMESVLAKKSQNLAWVGAQISKQQGSLLRYQATGEIGFLGDAAGEIVLDGNVQTRIPLFGDTVAITGYAHLHNTSAPYLLNEYLSNHFIWQNDFGKVRRLRFGGILNIPWTSTSVNIGTETLQNAIYFGPDAMPVQHSGSVQVFSATLDQKLQLGILHWDNKITYQTTTSDEVVPLPKLALQSNLYLLCKIATLHLQLGVDCDYYTSYYAPGYQPATATFYNQREMKMGNYPFFTAYANMKLDRVRFYVMMTHVNQGWPKPNYFSSPHYPLNPRRFQMGLSVEFWD